MGRTAEEIAEALGGKRSGGGWTARCPAHDDDTPSLSLRQSGDKTLWHCHAGCSQDAVRDALIVRGLWDEPTPRDAPRTPRGSSSGLGRIEATYDYCDERGELLHQTVRFEGKKFRQRRPVGNDWEWSLRGCKRVVVYRLPALLAAWERNPDRITFLCEGEKDADNLAALDCLTSTNPMGAGNWRPEFSETFRGRSVVLLPDNDEAGEGWLSEVWHALQGVAAKVRYLRLPGLPAKGDVSDWIKAGGTKDGLSKLVGVIPADQEAPAEPHRKAHKGINGHAVLGDGSDADFEPDEATERWVQPVGDEPAEELPEPVNLFERKTLVPLKPEWLPPAIAPYVFDQCEVLGADPGTLAIACLVACASCIHDDIKVLPRRIDPTWRESARLWGVFVGDPSGKKSPTLDRAVSHIKKIDMDVSERSQAEENDYKLRQKAYKKAEAEWVNNGGKGDPPPAPEKPPRRRLWLDEITVEAAGILLADNPRGCLAVQDELTGWFASMDAYRQNGAGKDRAAWLQAYNGGPKRVDRVTRDCLIVPNWSISLIGGIQPDAIRKIAAGLPEDGLLQRFMIVNAIEQDGIGVDRLPNMTALEGYRALLDALYATQPGLEPVRMSAEAITIREASDEHWQKKRKQEFLPAGLRASLGKWSGLFARLALVHHCIDCALRNVYPSQKQISADTAHRVAAFMREFLWPHAEWFYDNVLTTSDASKHAEWAAGYILAHDAARFSMRDMRRSYKRWKSTTDEEKWATFKHLMESGWLLQPTRARASTWTVNPLVHQNFSSIKEFETERRKRAMDDIRSTSDDT